jgi:hypothetical protein
MWNTRLGSAFPARDGLSSRSRAWRDGPARRKEQSRLLNTARLIIRARHCKWRTEKVYVGWTRRWKIVEE